MPLDITQANFEQAIEMTLDRVYAKTDNTIACALINTPYLITFDSYVNAPSGLSTGLNDQIVAGRAGTAVLKFNGAVVASGVSGSEDATIRIRKNGSATGETFIVRRLSNDASGSFSVTGTFTGVIATDYFQVYIETSGTNDTFTFDEATFALEWQE